MTLFKRLKGVVMRILGMLLFFPSFIGLFIYGYMMLHAGSVVYKMPLESRMVEKSLEFHNDTIQKRYNQVLDQFSSIIFKNLKTDKFYLSHEMNPIEIRLIVEDESREHGAGRKTGRSFRQYNNNVFTLNNTNGEELWFIDKTKVLHTQNVARHITEDIVVHNFDLADFQDGEYFLSLALDSRLIKDFKNNLEIEVREKAFYPPQLLLWVLLGFLAAGTLLLAITRKH